MQTTNQTVIESEQEPLLSQVVLSICDPLTVLMLTLESLKPGQVLSEADHRLMLQHLNQINRIVKCCRQE